MKLASAHPDAADLFDFRLPAVREVYERIQQFLGRILEGSVSNWTLPASRVGFAATLTYGLRGLRNAATDIDDMRRLTFMSLSTQRHFNGTTAPTDNRRFAVLMHQAPSIN